MRDTPSEHATAPERLRDELEAERAHLERKIAALQIERNELGRAMRSNSDTCHQALERVMQDGDKELKEWLASTRTEETPRPPNAVVIARFLFETTDFGEWLVGKLDEAIAADPETYDPRSTRRLKQLCRKVETQLAKARAELKLRQEECLAAGAAVRREGLGTNFLKSGPASN